MSQSFAIVQAVEPAQDAMACEPFPQAGGVQRRVICADVSAIDHMLVYNRFGSFNPFGMIFALTRDLSSSEVMPEKITADACDMVTGAEPGVGALEPGKVRLKDCKRARPLVLRAGVGDILHLRLTNLLTPNPPDFSRDFCNGDVAASGAIRAAVSQGSEAAVALGEAACASTGAVQSDDQNTPSLDWPSTRSLSMAVQGLSVIAGPDGERNDACLGTKAFAPGESVDCYYEIDIEGTYFFSSKAAPSGGEGGGGSITHGLFGAVVAEQHGTAWYRSQVSKRALDKAWPRSGESCPASALESPHTRTCTLNYDLGYGAGEADIPVLRMTKQIAPGAEQLVHSDLNAIVYRPAGPDPLDPAKTLAEVNFREFSVFFHDELKSFFTRNFEELGRFGQLEGVRDGFAINYGASGMGTLLLANRKNIGPANDCPECLYEEFFLQSWANGDPALLEQFPDDPSNVHHSYLNDAVVFRNFHAGPKETHVFHLHAHQWFSGNDPNRGSYLDSQTVAPQQGFTYSIYRGGLNGNPLETGGMTPPKGSWETLGSGNRNRTIGDSIFHCHLYPHFAQGMWSLWRVHDVLEDGLRKLPDGQHIPGLSLDEREAGDVGRRLGSFDQATGAFRASPTGSQNGTPIPAIVPLPDAPLPPIPTYSVADNANAAMPGYPFYIAGKPGHRAPQAPLDIAQRIGPDRQVIDGDYLDGGLPRHVLKDGGERELDIADTPVGALNSQERRASQAQILAKMLALGNFAGSLTKAELDLLPYDGTVSEKAAMAFHYNGAGVDVRAVTGAPAGFVAAQGGYPTGVSPAANGGASSFGATAQPLFHVNASPPRPGAPFADPCGVSVAAQPTPLLNSDPLFNATAPYYADPALIGFRRYEVSAVQLDLVTNRAGWHDPQARINVLSADSARFKDDLSGKELSISPIISGNEQPFFFRALSGECIEFRHTNELPKDLERDDFQVRTPTDTIGQHIHLVKFDVTSSDGSANGWNYEDGTLAADEVATRICAAYRYADEENPASIGQVIKANRALNELAIRMPAGFCDSPQTTSHTWWRQRLDGARDHFQTTTQRWFADPILSPRYSPSYPGDGLAEKALDRTLRTVFTHDHFGPSSIQQHGFYSALVIEPASARICDPTTSPGSHCEARREPGDLSLAEGTVGWTGAAKIIDTVDVASRDINHPDYREFALAIADFATLYDPRDYQSESAFRAANLNMPQGAPQGMATLVCEAIHRGDPAKLRQFCGSAIAQDTSLPGNPWGAPINTPPAWVAAGKPLGLQTDFARADILTVAEIAELERQTIRYRKLVAGSATGDRLAKPVAPPQRPESISVDHHDPYLVNYRGEPLPLRIGTDQANARPSSDCALRPIEAWSADLRAGADIANCSIERQIGLKANALPEQGPSGDMADVFLSAFHGDPVTPILEGYDGERIVMRLVQGAQEVQHTFNVEGYTFQRHIDQAFASGHVPLDVSSAMAPGLNGTLNVSCQSASGAISGRPTEYAKWRKDGLAAFPPVGGERYLYWQAYERLLASCDNIEGLVSAQEVGISEHFEFSGQFRQALSGAERVLLDTPVQSMQPTTDYLYHFGSADALWNGAWGLTRIFRDQNARDLTACAPNDADCTLAVGERLLALADISQNDIGIREGRSAADVATRQVLSCRAGAPKVHAVIAALEVSRIWPGGFPTSNGNIGTPYGEGLYDRNGLMFALIDPQLLFPGKAREALEYDPQTGTAATAKLWQNIALSKITAIVRQTYERPEPLVVRVNADDCVTLHVINGLTTYGNTAGLVDDRGDARMPPITPLNVDIEWSEPIPIGVAGSDFDQLPGRFEGEAGGDVRPSARLALSIPLPSLNHTQTMPLPFGQNVTTTLAPANCTGGPARCTMSLAVEPLQGDTGFLRRRDSIESLTFYAGRTALKSKIDDLDEKIVDTIADVVALKPGLGLVVGDIPLPPAPQGDLCTQDQGVAVELLGRAHRLCVRDETSEAYVALGDALATAPGAPTLADASQTLLDSWKTQAEILLGGDDYVHWTPYAFGSLPIKSTGDIIGHGAHGLFGALVVQPQGAQIGDDERAPLADRLFALKPRDRGNLWTAQILSKGPDGVDHTLREFVLFYQDGLNLRDTGTANRWVSGGGTARLMADCEVCDDSYDLGDRGVNYRSDPFYERLRGEQVAGQHQPEAQLNLNAFVFPDDFLRASFKAHNMPMLRAEAGDEVVVRVIHPGGRARQRSFALIGNDYDDLFPGFGFPHSALLAPGKGIRASLTRKVTAGCYLWHDGTTVLSAGGTWGLIDVVGAGEFDNPAISSCGGGARGDDDQALAK